MFSLIISAIEHFLLSFLLYLKLVSAIIFVFIIIPERNDNVLSSWFNVARANKWRMLEKNAEENILIVSFLTPTPSYGGIKMYVGNKNK